MLWPTLHVAPVPSHIANTLSYQRDRRSVLGPGRILYAKRASKQMPKEVTMFVNCYGYRTAL